MTEPNWLFFHFVYMTMCASPLMAFDSGDFAAQEAGQQGVINAIITWNCCRCLHHKYRRPVWFESRIKHPCVRNVRGWRRLTVSLLGVKCNQCQFDVSFVEMCYYFREIIGIFRAKINRCHKSHRRHGDLIEMRRIQWKYFDLWCDPRVRDLRHRKI